MVFVHEASQYVLISHKDHLVQLFGAQYLCQCELSCRWRRLNDKAVASLLIVDVQPDIPLRVRVNLMTQMLPFGDVLARRVSSIPGAPRAYSKVLSIVDKDLLAHRHRLPANKLQLRQIVILHVPRHSYDFDGV